MQNENDPTFHTALSSFISSICLSPQMAFADNYKRKQLSLEESNNRCWARPYIYGLKLALAPQLGLFYAHLSQNSCVRQEIPFGLYCSPTSPIGIRPLFRARVATFGMYDSTQSNSMPANNGSLVHDVQE